MNATCGTRQCAPQELFINLLFFQSKPNRRKKDRERERQIEREKGIKKNRKIPSFCPVFFCKHFAHEALVVI